MKTLAFIPAKSHSARLRNKNVQVCGGVPLVIRALQVAQEARDLGLIDSVVVSVDEFDPVIRTMKQAGYDSWEYQPADIRGKNIPVIQVLRRWLEDHAPAQGHHRPEIVCVLWPTSPLREVGHLVGSFRLLTPEVDAVLSVTDCRENPRTTCVVDPDGVLRLWHPGQLREQGYQYARHNGVVLWAWTRWLLTAKEFYDSSRLVPYWMAPDESVDIDTPLDLEWADFLLARRAKV